MDAIIADYFLGNERFNLPGQITMGSIWRAYEPNPGITAQRKKYANAAGAIQTIQ
jgi:hypothetical protein